MGVLRVSNQESIWKGERELIGIAGNYDYRNIGEIFRYAIRPKSLRVYLIVISHKFEYFQILFNPHSASLTRTSSRKSLSINNKSEKIIK